jgi:hypothetical protein
MSKTDLTDVSFLIALKIDSKDRIDNLDITIEYLQHHFDTEIIISEQSKKSLIKGRYNCKHIFTEVDEFFNRQRGVNIAASQSTKPIIAHYDADVILTPQQIVKAVEAIRSGTLELASPYNGYFYDVPKLFHKEIADSHSIDCIDISQCKMFSPRSVGGVVFFNREVFWQCGGANENFKGLGYEDDEIFERFKKLKIKMGRVTKPLFHLTHVRTETAYDHNPFVNANRDEFTRIQNMTQEQLEQEIKQWKWVNYA